MSASAHATKQDLELLRTDLRGEIEGARTDVLEVIQNLMVAMEVRFDAMERRMESMQVEMRAGFNRVANQIDGLSKRQETTEIELAAVKYQLARIAPA